MPDPGAPANTIGGAGADRGGEELGGGRAQRAPVDQLVEPGERHPGEAADVDHEVAAAGEVAVDDVEARAVVELGVLEALARVELAVARGRVVEQLGERAGDVVVVVEALVVVAARPGVALHEDLGRRVDLDLPHVGVVEQLGERAVAGEVAPGPLGDELGVGEPEAAAAAAHVVVPAGQLVVDEGAQRRAPGRGAHVEGDVLGPGLHRLLHLGQRGEVVGPGWSSVAVMPRLPARGSRAARAPARASRPTAPRSPARSSTAVDRGAERGDQRPGEGRAVEVDGVEVAAGRHHQRRRRWPCRGRARRAGGRRSGSARPGGAAHGAPG